MVMIEQASLNTAFVDKLYVMAARQREGDERPYGGYTMRYRQEDQGERKPRHVIETYHPDGSKVGQLTWHGTHHRVLAIATAQEHRGRGIASAMWDWSQEMTPRAKHSTDQTDPGKGWVNSLGRPRKAPPEIEPRTAMAEPEPLDVREYEGRTGDPSHITRSERGMIPVSWIARTPGAAGERPGEHRNRQGQDWEGFKSDVAANGVQDPVFVTVDHGQEPQLSEGNHRRDAAAELGHTHIPAEVRYFGHAEQQGTLEQRAAREPGSPAQPSPQRRREATAMAEHEHMGVEDLLDLHSNEALRRERHRTGHPVEHSDATKVRTVYDRKAGEMAQNEPAWSALDEPIRKGTIDPVLLEKSPSGHTVVSEGHHRIVRARQLGVTHLPVSYDPGSQAHRDDWEEPEPLEERTASARDDQLAAMDPHEPEQPSFTHNYETYGPDGGYVSKSRVVTGPFYHGGRANVGPGDMLTKGRKPNNWGDEGPKSTHNYFSTDKGSAASYSRSLGNRGHLYEVEPTGHVKQDYQGTDWKTEHPLRVIRKVPREEWDTQHQAAALPAKKARVFSPVAYAADAIEQTIGAWEPGHMVNVGELLGDLPGFFTREAVALDAMVTRLREEYPLDPGVSDHYSELISGLTGMAAQAREGLGLYRASHEADIRRLEEPRANEDRWDVDGL